MNLNLIMSSSPTKMSPQHKPSLFLCSIHSINLCFSITLEKYQIMCVCMCVVHLCCKRNLTHLLVTFTVPYGDCASFSLFLCGKFFVKKSLPMSTLNQLHNITTAPGNHQPLSPWLLPFLCKIRLI